MTSRRPLAVLAVAGVLSAGPPAAAPARADALPAPAAEYSAMQRLTVDGRTLEARVNHARGLERREVTVAGVRSVIIQTEGGGYQVQPELGIALELPPGEESDAGPDLRLLCRLDGTAEGTDTIAGEQAVRYRVRGDAGAGVFEGRAWSTPDGICLRVRGTLGAGGAPVAAEPVTVEMDLQDIRRGPQDPSLFRLPPGTRTMSLGPIPGRVPEAFREGGK